MTISACHDERTVSDHRYTVCLKNNTLNVDKCRPIYKILSHQITEEIFVHTHIIKILHVTL